MASFASSATKCGARKDAWTKTKIQEEVMGGGGCINLIALQY